MKLDRVILNVTQPKTLATFYHRHLGMTITPIEDHFIVGYDGSQQAQVELRQAQSGNQYTHSDTDVYWKIGITLPDIGIAFQQLQNAGVTVSKPQQFRDIGYLCHVSDPEGFRVELLQHTFKHNPQQHPGDNTLPLGGGTRIGQITLRVSEIDTAIAHYRNELGMRLLSIQRVPDLGFDLYFLAFTTEAPPVTDLESVENREWLWQRPYTTLELQHIQKPVLANEKHMHNPGYHGLCIEDTEGEKTIY